MDTSADTSSTRDEPAKKSAYDDLTREELVKKCKGLLLIAQKAKQSKQELQTEVEQYKGHLEQSLKEKNADADNLRTLQELVDSLTEQKLNYITEIDTANGRHAALAVQLDQTQKKVVEYEGKLADMSVRASDLDSEVISLRRQNQRMGGEIEELINQLGELEARVGQFNTLGLQQREQLQMLEQTVDRGTPDTIVEDYQKKIDDLNIQIESMEKDLASQNEKLTESEQETKTLAERLSLETIKYETEKDKKEKANARLKSYRDKIIKCSNCISQLKNTKCILLKTVKDYSESIPKWQDDMIKISKMLSEQFNEITSENKAIKQQIFDYEQSLTITKNSIEALQKENAELQRNNKELNSLVESLQNDNNKTDTSEILNLQIKALESEKHMLVKEKNSARDGLIELEAQNKKFVTDVKSLHTNIESLEARINFLECENKTLKEQLGEKDTKQCKELKEKLKILQEQFEALKTENTNIADLNNLLSEEVETLKSSLERPNDDEENLSDLNVSLQTDIMKLETKLAAYKQENSSLLAEVKESRAKIKEMNAANAELEDVKAKMVGYKTENTELLNEMKEVNQVLKERGESISKQQKAIAEMERLVETLEKDRAVIGESKSELERIVKELEGEIEKISSARVSSELEVSNVRAERDEIEKTLAEKETVVSALREEIEKLKQQQLAGSMEHPSEDMSTSTISRADDHSRMKELDETFEDKYTKLRIFALKLKKRVNEMTVQLQEVEADKSRLEKLLGEAGAAAGGPQAVQLEYEKALNLLEEKSAQMQSITKENEELRSKLSSSGSEENANIDTDARKRVKESMQTNEVGTTDTEAVRDAEALEKLKTELSKKESQLSSEIEQHKVTKESLEKARRDVKKKSVLSLEMEDYERSMKDLTSKMEDNKKKMVQMESTVDTQQGTITSLKTQIKLLEDQIKTEENQNRLTKEELHASAEELKDKDTLIRVKNEVIAKLEQDIETGKRVYEDLNIEMATLLGEKEKVILSLSHDKMELGSRLKRVECRCTELEDSLKVTNIELEDLKTEFTSYKVRAQAVLRQNQTVDHSHEEQLKEELAATRSQADSLRTQLDAANAEVEEARAAGGAERRRASEAAGEAARAAQRTARLHADLQRITQQLDTERAHAKLQITTLTQCYKSQISELEARLERETLELRAEAEAARESAKSAAAGGARAADYMMPVIPKDDSDVELDINVSMLPREEGEGSEAAPSPPLSKPYASIGGGGGSGRSPVPLERLLEEGVPDEDASDGSNLGLTVEQELMDAKRKLHAQMLRVEHVTLLLAESERECARHAQLAELLKAEVRRARGAQHAHNTQYMKNVTLKFLTLPVGDERCRLVPVLQKILTLSNEEAHTLAAVAKGQDPNAKGGWGSYLPWTGK